jgi:peptidyl-prolyl cis-trans isomerase D
MAIIDSIRKRTALLLFIILGALVAFILTDFFSSRQLLSRKQIIGEIDGREVELSEFQNELEIQKATYEMNSGVAPTPEQMFYVRGLAWENLIYKIAYQAEFEKLGIDVTDEEIVDMIQGNNPIPEIAQSFTNKETGKFEPKAVVAFLKDLNKYPADVQQRFLFIEQNLPMRRKREKYEALMSKTVYATKLEAKQRYTEQNAKRDLRYLYVPYSSVPDSLVKVTDSDLQSYYDNHKKDYEGEAMVSLEYALFPLTPSKEDTARIFNELEALKPQFEATQKDTPFVNMHSRGGTPFRVLRLNEIPKAVTDAGAVEVGKVVGPVLNGDMYVLYKVIGEREDSIYSMRASHILIAANQNMPDSARATAKKKAQDILKRALAGEDFAALAAQYGEDGTKSKGGDLGWFLEKAMVAPFEEAVLAASQKGVLKNLVETEFGYHIINVTETKTKKQYVMAAISRELSPSTATRDAVYRKAGMLSMAKNAQEWEEQLKGFGQISIQANDVPQNSRNINNLRDADVRQVLLWAFNEDEAKIGQVSKEIYEIENNYLVVRLKERTAKGVQPLSKVKERVRAEVLKEKKALIILSELKKASGSLDQIASAYGKGAQVHSMQGVALHSFSLNAVGSANKAIGWAFANEAGAQSNPIQDENGILIVKVEKVEDAPEIADYASYKEQIEQARRNVSASNVRKAIEQITKAENKIDKYY